MPKLAKLPELNLIAAALELEAAAPGGESPKERRFSMTAYTGGAMQLAGWRFPVVVDLAGLEVGRQKRPILLDHTRDVEFVLGQTDQIHATGGQLQVAGHILGDSGKARQVIGLADKGFQWQASIGAKANEVEFVPEGKSVLANGREFSGPVNIARRAALGEISFVVLGADDNTSAQIAAALKGDNMDFDQWLAARGFEPAVLTDQQRTSLRGLFDAESLEASKDAGRRAPAANEGSTQDGEHGASDASAAVAQLRAELGQELARTLQIRKICAGRFPEIEAKSISEGWDAQRTELEVLRVGRPTGPAIHASEDPKTPRALEAALCMSAGLPADQVSKWYDAPTMDAASARDLQGAGIHTLLYEVIRASGGYVRPGRVDNDTIRAAFVANDRTLQAAGGFSTISLSGILSNVANKAMLAAYEAVNVVSQEFCSETDVNDFKQVTRYRMTGSGVFQKVGPDGELKHAELSEESYTNQVETYGRMIALTRQMIINDDLGAFLQIPRAIGRMSALALEEIVFTLLLSNPGSFFSNGNANLLTIASTLDIDTLTQAEQMFLDRVDQHGKPILVQPAVLLVPTSLKVVAEQLYKDIWLNQVPANNKAKPASNPHAGKFRPVASPYLNLPSLPGHSATDWYLFADPGDVSAIEIAYLRGKRAPTIESAETNFNTLGVQYRGFFDFGANVQDSRAAVKATLVTP